MNTKWKKINDEEYIYDQKYHVFKENGHWKIYDKHGFLAQKETLEKCQQEIDSIENGEGGLCL